MSAAFYNLTKDHVWARVRVRGPPRASAPYPLVRKFRVASSRLRVNPLSAAPHPESHRRILRHPLPATRSGRGGETRSYHAHPGPPRRHAVSRARSRVPFPVRGEERWSEDASLRQTGLLTRRTPAPERRLAVLAPSAMVLSTGRRITDPGYMSRKIESLERINSIRDTNKKLDLCKSCK